jgi:MATE family multidrug resistance protein
MEAAHSNLGREKRLQSKLTILRREIPPLVALAWPLALANLGWMAMVIVDTMMVGRISAEAIGAVSLGGIVFSTAGIFGSGILLGLDALVPQAYGSGNVEDCHRSLLSSLYLCIPLSAVLMGSLWLLEPQMRRWGITAGVLEQTVPYLDTLIWGMPLLLLYFAFRGYLQGMNVVKPIMFALVTANLVNALMNWVLIFGHWGAPALGVVGAGWSTFIARVYMAAALGVSVWYYDRRHATSLFDIPLEPDWARMGRLFRIGLPAALQILVEIAVFTVATAMIGTLDVVSLAAHQIALNTVSLTYMVPLGVGAAAAVRVGQELGRGDLVAAGDSGWAALALGAAFMSCAAVVLWLVPEVIARIYTPDPVIVRAGASLLVIAGFFQLFDGLQTVATGALRGAGDTHTPMICHLIAYWAIGLPVGYYFCFSRGQGARGMWIGLALALILIGSVLAAVWRHKTARWKLAANAVAQR